MNQRKRFTLLTWLTFMRLENNGDNIPFPTRFYPTIYYVVISVCV